MDRKSCKIPQQIMMKLWILKHLELIQGVINRVANNSLNVLNIREKFNKHYCFRCFIKKNNLFTLKWLNVIEYCMIILA